MGKLSAGEKQRMGHAGDEEDGQTLMEEEMIEEGVEVLVVVFSNPESSFGCRDWQSPAIARLDWGVPRIDLSLAGLPNVRCSSWMSFCIECISIPCSTHETIV